MDNYQLIPGQHTGFIPVDPAKTDWVHGQESGVISKAINTLGDWRTYQSPGKRQRDPVTGFESDACVSFAAHDMLQTYGNFLIQHNMLPADTVAWLQANGYFDSTGLLNFSPRFLAKVSKTTTAGNSLPNVLQSARDFGMVPYTMWPTNFEAMVADPATGGESAANWATFYSDIPQNVLDMGLEFKKRLEVQYEWVAYPGANMTPTAFSQQLQYSPLEIATAVCMPWNTDQVIAACGAGTAHATMMSDVDPACCYHILDHYIPFNKEFALDYTITYAMRGILAVPVPPTPRAPFKHTFTAPILYGETNAEVSYLQQALKADGEFKLDPTGYYGNITAAAVLAFQQKYAVASPAELTALDGKRVGPATVAQLNKLFS
jgi:hypothetical protein